MKKPVILLTLLLLHFAAIAQNTPGEYLELLQDLPDSFCKQTPEAIMKWADCLTPIRDRMQELLAEEKSAREEAVAKGEPNMALFDPSNEAVREKFRLTAEKSEALQQKVTISQQEVLSAYVEEKGRVTIKYTEPLRELNMEFEEALAAGRNTNVLRERIRAMEATRCEELTVIRREYLTAYRKFLEDNMSTFIRINELTDEMNRMTYASYSFKTRYGAWMEILLAFTEELALIFDDAPGTGSIDGELR